MHSCHTTWVSRAASHARWSQIDWFVVSLFITLSRKLRNANNAVTPPGSMRLRFAALVIRTIKLTPPASPIHRVTRFWIMIWCLRQWTTSSGLRLLDGSHPTFFFLHFIRFEAHQYRYLDLLWLSFLIQLVARIFQCVLLIVVPTIYLEKLFKIVFSILYWCLFSLEHVCAYGNHNWWNWFFVHWNSLR